MNTTITLVREIYIPLEQYPHLQEDEPIGNGVALLLQNSSDDNRHLHYDEIFVTDGNSKLMGHISVSDILTSFFPSILATETKSIYSGKKELFTDLSILLEDSFQRECRRQAVLTVKKYMTPPHRSVDGSMHLLHALEIMIKDRVTTLPVTIDGKLAGAVRLQDIFRILGTYCTI